MSETSYIGYLKYSGASVKDGYLDATKTAEALLGFDKALRFFVEDSLPELKGKPFEIPVRIQKGSWEALIPTSIGQWIATFGIATTTNPFLFSDAFREALKMMQWAIQICVHLQGESVKTIRKIGWGDNDTIPITNSAGKTLEVPKKYFDKYSEMPPKYLSQMARLVQDDREMKIGVMEGGRRVETGITMAEKYFFTEEEEELTEVLFPELVHGQVVNLNGVTTRGNLKTNSMGLEYKGHILSCTPERGSVAVFKHALYCTCTITGVVNRKSDFSGLLDAKKPKITFSSIVPINRKSSQLELFKREEN